MHGIVPHSRFKILLAPDSFKGSLSASAACDAMQRGALRAAQACGVDESTLHLELVPLADGGEGTLEAFVRGAGGREFSTRVRDPLGCEVAARWGVLDSGIAVVEMAEASGLTLIEKSQRDALRASSFGTGQLIKAALDFGCEEILIGIGGSATTDGGAGALSALGARFLEATGKVLAPGGAALNGLHSIDLSNLDERLKSSRFTALCDVTNPLFGENGAAFIYAPQKGASEEDVKVLDSGLRRLAAVAAQTLGQDGSSRPGAGAAGGVGFGLMMFLNAHFKSGIEVVLQAARFEEKLQGADLVLTGEGALDAQTLSGKAVAGMCRSAQKQKVPVIALGGKVSLSSDDQSTLGLLSAFPLPDAPMSLEECITRADELLENVTERVMCVWFSAQ
jgi:glycerate kinase